MKPYKVIVLPDMHVPFHDRKALKAVEKYMADENWDHWIQLGDFLDLASISSFSKAALKQVDGETIQAEYDAGGKILDRHRKILGKKCKMTLFEGNHEHRVEKYIDEHPQLRGIIEVERGLNLKERNIEWIRCWSEGSVYEVGNVQFLHGNYLGNNHSKKMLDVYGNNGKSVVYGHTHDIQGRSKLTFGNDNMILSQSMGMLCEYEQEYIGKNPSNWAMAFGVFYFQPDGNFNHYVVRINDGKFIAPNGKRYG